MSHLLGHLEGDLEGDLEGEDLVSHLLGHLDGRECFKSALLLLHPEDLKKCRLVSSSWNEFILDELWGTRSGREKLVEGWMVNNEATMVRIGKARNEMQSIFCNRAHEIVSFRTGVYMKNLNIPEMSEMQ